MERHAMNKQTGRTTKRQSAGLKGAKPKAEGVSDIQRGIWEFIRRNVEEKGFPPTLRELGDAFEIASTNGIRYHLRVLTEHGYIEHQKGSRRGLRLLNPDGSSPFQWNRSIEVNQQDLEDLPDNVVPFPERRPPEGLSHWWKPLPVIGRVAAGSPILAEENKEDEIGVDQALFGGGPNVDLFGLRVNGDSMVEVGIYDGDLAVVRKQRTARPNEIVVATVNDEATVKRYLPEEERIVLKPENKDYEPIIVTPEDRFRIVGVVVGIIRRKVQ
jgi:repressor LexA